uniref:Uncharacterized protein n=1 Tax=Glossina pallidipes TaxID=7398 RepID=A0A1B0A9E2_GLOPL
MNIEQDTIIIEMESEGFENTDNTENMEEDRTIMNNPERNEQNDDTVRILANDLLTTTRETALIQEVEELKAEIAILKGSRSREVEKLNAESGTVADIQALKQVVTPHDKIVQMPFDAVYTSKRVRTHNTLNR